MKEPSEFEIIDDEPEKPKRSLKKKSSSFLRQSIIVSLPISAILLIGLFIVVGGLVIVLHQQRDITFDLLDLETTPDPDLIPTCGASPSAPAGSIVFSAGLGGGGADLYIIQSDSSNLCRLTNSPGHEYRPIWTEQEIFYSWESAWGGYADVYSIRPDGTGNRFVIGGTEKAAVSPDKRFIAYGQRGDIFVRELAGIEIALTNTENISEGYPIWSPDSRWVAYSGEGRIYIADISCVLVAVPPMACEARPIPLPISDEINQIILSDWSPDGLVLAFEYRTVNISRLAAIDINGTNFRPLTQGDLYSFHPNWSPDGQQIVYSVLLPDDINPSLFIQNLETSDVQRLTPAISAFDPDWVN